MNNTLMVSTDQQVRERRIQLLPLFEDYDPVHSGCVSHSQVTILPIAYMYTGITCAATVP